MAAINSVPAVHFRPSESSKTMQMGCSDAAFGSGLGATAKRMGRFKAAQGTDGRGRTARRGECGPGRGGEQNLHRKVTSTGVYDDLQAGSARGSTRDGQGADTVSVTANILQRTFLIHHDGSTGTCFSIDVEGRRYLITAKHVVESIVDEAVVEISHESGWLRVPVRLVGHGAGEIDVTALAPQELFGAAHALNLTTARLVLAEDVYFLGFPYGLGMEVKMDLNAGFPLPLVKKAVVSSLGLDDGPLLLDGHNNAGFSGGPVARRGTKEEQTVIGVVSGYRFDRHRVRDEHGNETSHTYDTNTGIVIAHDIRHALEIVAGNPIGISVV